MLQQSIREVRTVSYLLHPPLLDEAGLGLALRNFVEGFMERSGIAVALEVSPDLGRLPADIELVLFRIVQEALTNVARHSGSPTARIHLAYERQTAGPQVVLTIEDAGRGMPETAGIRGLIGRNRSSPAMRGVGLASMRERLHQIDGRLAIASEPGYTRIKAVVPIRERPSD
jgi:signal transduction histidine kinase